MAAGSAGGDENFAGVAWPVRQLGFNLRFQAVLCQVEGKRALQRFRLLIDFAQHFMGKSGHRPSLRERITS